MTQENQPQFRPDSIIELDDPLTGGRRLVLVGPTGTEFFDYIDCNDPPMPFPILPSLNPVDEAGCSYWANTLMFSGDVPKWHGFEDLTDALFDTILKGKLARNRAAYAAYTSGDYNIEKAVAAGLKAEAEARQRQAIFTQGLPGLTEKQKRKYYKFFVDDTSSDEADAFIKATVAMNDAIRGKCVEDAHKAAEQQAEMDELRKHYDEALAKANIPPPDLNGDEHDDEKLKRYADMICLALGVGRLESATAFIESWKAIGRGMCDPDDEGEDD